MLQFEEYLLQELLRNALPLGDFGNRQAALLGLREGDEGPQGLLGFLGNHRGAGSLDSSGVRLNELR
jgi:hypothetical protein